MKISNETPVQCEREQDARACEVAEESQRIMRKMKQEAGERLEPALKAGAVAAPDVYSAHEAEAVLAEGGNAVDAAVAAAFVLSVTYPEAGNIGGGGFMNIHYDGSPYFLDYRECAPANARRDMYLDEAGEVVPACAWSAVTRSPCRAPCAGCGTRTAGSAPCRGSGWWRPRSATRSRASSCIAS